MQTDNAITSQYGIIETVRVGRFHLKPDISQQTNNRAHNIGVEYVSTLRTRFDDK